MAEAQRLDVNTPQTSISPQTCLSLLMQLRQAFTNASDHSVLQHTCDILHRCRLPFAYQLQNRESHNQSISDFYDELRLILRVGYELLRSVFFRIEDRGFNSFENIECMKSHLNTICRTLTRMTTLLENTILNLSADLLQKHSINSVCYLLNSYLSKEYPYETHPKHLEGRNRLWRKVKKMSINELTEDSPENYCVVCYDKDKDTELAILDSCPHIVCLPCAHRLFNLPTESDRKCPMCRTLVETYTSRHHAERYIAATNFSATTEKRSTLLLSPALQFLRNEHETKRMIKSRIDILNTWKFSANFDREFNPL